MAWSSSIPAAVDALFTGVRDTFAESDDLKVVKVQDGPLVGGGHYKQAFMVGYSPIEDVPAVSDNSNGLEGVALNPQRERFTVNCTIEVLDGNGNVQRARSRVYAIAAAVGQFLSGNPKLDGTVMRAWIAAAAPLDYQEDAPALLVTAALAIACDAYTGR